MEKPDLNHARIVHGEDETSSFHWRDGLHFKRMESGGVRVVKHADYPSQAIPVMDFVIPPNEWASIVASVSKGGETGESYRSTLAFHMGNNSDPQGPFFSTTWERKDYERQQRGLPPLGPR